jgi:hypothetical protein
MKLKIVFDMEDKISTWLWANIGWHIKNIYISISNIIRWLPIIWKDRDWDHSFIFIILREKLKHQAEYIRKNDRHTLALYDAQRIMTCVRLIDKIIEDSYSTEYLEFYESEIITTKLENSDSYKLDVKIKSSCVNDYFLMYPLDYKRVLNGAGWLDINNADSKIERNRLIAMNMSHLRGQRAKKILFQLLDRHIEGWWD